MRWRNRSPNLAIVAAMRSISVMSIPSPMTFTLPQPSQAFGWLQVDDAPALVCTEFDRAAHHLFTTRAWKLGERTESPSDEFEGWRQVAGSLGLDIFQLARVHQV